MSNTATLFVQVIEAIGLKNVDSGQVQVEVFLNERNVGRTQFIQKSAQPVWNQLLAVPLSLQPVDDILTLSLVGKHWIFYEFLGRTEIPVSLIAATAQIRHEAWFKLLPKKRSVDDCNSTPGYLHLALQVVSPPSSTSASAQNLPEPPAHVPASAASPSTGARGAGAPVISDGVACPVCNVQFPANEIARHTNACLDLAVVSANTRTTAPPQAQQQAKQQPPQSSGCSTSAQAQPQPSQHQQHQQQQPQPQYPHLLVPSPYAQPLVYAHPYDFPPVVPQPQSQPQQLHQQQQPMQPIPQLPALLPPVPSSAYYAVPQTCPFFYCPMVHPQEHAAQQQPNKTNASHQ